MAEAKKPLQQGVEDNLLDYYDIMVIGKTGAGKSTTVDKLLIACLPGQHQPKPRETEPTADPQNRALRCDNMVMWLISDKDFDLERVSLRLKNIVFFRSLENPHREVNASREAGMNIYQSTRHCELFSNESTKIRVLDVPGFFGHDAGSGADDLDSRMSAVKEFDLLTMRNILRIKNTHNFKFNRIVYFLPDKGSLKRTSQDLIIELGVMKEYFGRPIFESMVVVATLSSDAYEFIRDDGQNFFSEAKIEDTRRHFREALQDVFKTDDIPDPPIIFISLFDSCEVILRKIQTANVKQDSINLGFSSSICARCKFKVIKEGLGRGEVFSCISSEQLGSISQEETTCHPLMVPKYSKVVKFFGGVAHLITFRRFVGRWPNFESMDEECVNCKRPPKTHGCMQIGSKFMVGKESLVVAHSTSVMEAYQIEVAEDERDQEHLSCGVTQPPCPGPGSLQEGDQPRGKYYVYPDGREVYKQEPALCNSPSTDLKG